MAKIASIILLKNFLPVNNSEKLNDWHILITQIFRWTSSADVHHSNVLLLSALNQLKIYSEKVCIIFSQKRNRTILCYRKNVCLSQSNFIFRMLLFKSLLWKFWYIWYKRVDCNLCSSIFVATNMLQHWVKEGLYYVWIDRSSIFIGSFFKKIIIIFVSWCLFYLVNFIFYPTQIILSCPVSFHSIPNIHPKHLIFLAKVPNILSLNV